MFCSTNVEFNMCEFVFVWVVGGLKRKVGRSRDNFDVMVLISGLPYGSYLLVGL